VRAALLNQPPATTVQADPYAGAGAGWGGDDASPGPVAPRRMVPGERQMRLDLGVTDSHPDSSEDDTAIPDGLGRPARPRTLPILRVIGQVGATYVIAEGPVGVYLLDQHSAHARVLYEHVVMRLEQGDPAEQIELEAVTVELPPSVVRWVEAALDDLSALGFDVELFGSHTFRVRAVPSILMERDPVDVLHDLACTLQESGAADEVGTLDLLAARVCTLAAYRAGETLSYDQMEGLVRELERCSEPLVSLDGGPTLVHISGEDLARQFGRG
jgi:DNA mismatch repair protein MutL